ncbi:MAG: diaminopimelate epimerase [Acidobacteriota bacterium]
MIQYIPFAKMSGAGNDFVVIDNRQQLILHPDAAARTLCDRRLGIGADGLLLVEKSTLADFTMKYYNADGSSGGMCGNGGRCIAMFAFREHIADHRLMRFDALEYVYQAEVTDGMVILSMKNPVDLRLNKRLKVNGLDVCYHFINTGTAHCVVLMDENPGLFAADFESASINELGRAIRQHADFAPFGTNVNFIDVRDSAIVQRTYERGVEDETLACGTGSVASSIIVHLLRGVAMPVTVRVRSGELLRIDFTEDGATKGITNVTLEGSARIVYEGTVVYDTERDTVC